MKKKIRKIYGKAFIVGVLLMSGALLFENVVDDMFSFYGGEE